MISFFATTAKELESLLTAELRQLGAVDVEPRRAGAAFSGNLATAYRACLWSRVANRVLLPLATFEAADEEALYAGVRAIDWRAHLGPDETLAVDFSSSDSVLAHTHYGALRTKDAIVDRLRDETGRRPSVARERPSVRVNVYLHRDRATVSIDLSGESLHRRGYRLAGAAGAAGAPAPLKENLAAAVLLHADWPRLAAAGTPLLDPMCGSGTLPIEAALIAADRAPGLARPYFGFLGWRGHQPAAWRQLLDEAQARARAAGDPRRLPPIVGTDADAGAVRTALANVERAGLRGLVHIEKRTFTDAAPLPSRATSPRGLVVMNPPYGERLGEKEALEPLYQQIGDTLRRSFPGWTGWVLTGDLALGRAIGLRPARRLVLYNGAIECRLYELPISEAPVGDEGPSWRKARPPSEASQMFVNRVTKNLKNLRRWAAREGIECYRVYDADLPEYAVAVDRYGDAAQVQEYAPPKTVDATAAAARLRDIVAVLPEALGVPPEQLFLKVRRRQRPGTQYTRGQEDAWREVREGGLTFRVNLSAYLDTGLFLDHRRLRALVRELAPGRRFLNLYAYTGTASVYAAAGQARSTTSVDLSNTYLEWAAENRRLNGFRARQYEEIRGDCLAYLADEQRRFGLIFVAPPTFSNSKRMEGTFDVQRDHVALLRAAAARLEPDGVILFSNHFRRFKMDRESLPELQIEEITGQTVPKDFARTPRVHNAWRITHRVQGREPPPTA